MLGHELLSPDEPIEDFELGLLEPSAVVFFWEEIEEILNAHPPREGLELFATVEDIKASLLFPSSYIWVGLRKRELELIVLCCFRQYPVTKTMEILYVGGKGLRRAFAHWPRIERWAQKCGATHVEARINSAMKRFYRPMGVKEAALYFRKPLTALAQ